ncbi:MAG: aminoacyl-tRNA hydrolase [bacterium]
MVGLGNPGFKYKRTRHNVGFQVIDQICKKYKAATPQRKKTYVLSETTFLDRRVILAKPMTFMNRSGDAVRELIDNFEIPLSNLLIIFDDLNLPFGKLRVRGKGSDGGHNGLASIIRKLDSTDFSRLRIGIGRERVVDKVNFVLSRFDREEKKALKIIISNSVDACFHFVTQGINPTMNKFN